MSTFARPNGVAGAITPVPGGVGPMTIAMLMANTVHRPTWRLAAGVRNSNDCYPDGGERPRTFRSSASPVEEPLMSDLIEGNRHFAFLLVDKFSMFSLAAAIDTFRSANRLVGRDFYGGPRFRRTARL